VSHTRNGRMCQHLYKYVEEYLPALGGGTTPESVDKAKNEKERKEEGRKKVRHYSAFYEQHDNMK